MTTYRLAPAAQAIDLHLAQAFSTDPDTAELERDQALADAIAGINGLLRGLHEVREHLVGVRAERREALNRHVDELLASSRLARQREGTG